MKNKDVNDLYNPEETMPEEEAILKEKVKDKQERAAFKRRKRAKRAEKALQNRHLKNFLLWIFGVIIGAIVTITGIFACFFVVPIDSWLKVAGQNPSNYVSEQIGGKSLFDAVLNASSYKVSDVPAVKDLFREIETRTGFIQIDTEAEDFDNVKFLEPLKLLEYIRISPSILGSSFSKLDLFQYTKVLEENKPDFSGGPISELDAKLYYYVTEVVQEYKLIDGVLTPVDVNRYALAVNEERTGYVDGVTESTDLYYCPVTDYSLADIQSIIGPRFNLITVKSIIKAFDSSVTDDSMIAQVLGDVTISNIGDLSIDEVLLSSIMPKTEENAKLYDILLSMVNNGKAEEDKITDEELAVKHLGSFDIGAITLGLVIEDNSSNAALYDVLKDAVGENVAELSISELSSSLDFTKVKMQTIIKDEPTDNKILQKIWNKNVGLSDVGEEINALSIEDIFDVEVFTKKVADTNDYSVIYQKSVSGDDVTYTLITDNNTTASDISGNNDYYYMSKKAGVWASVLYTPSGVDKTTFTGNVKTHDGTGLASTLTYEGLTFGEMGDGVSNISSNIMGYTIRQLYLFGIIEQNYTNIQGMLFTDVMSRLNNIG